MGVGGEGGEEDFKRINKKRVRWRKKTGEEGYISVIFSWCQGGERERERERTTSSPPTTTQHWCPSQKKSLLHSFFEYSTFKCPQSSSGQGRRRGEREPRGRKEGRGRGGESAWYIVQRGRIPSPQTGGGVCGLVWCLVVRVWVWGGGGGGWGKLAGSVAGWTFFL